MHARPGGFVPSKAFLTSGVGVHRERLTSFALARRDARVARYNLVNVSSIFPTRCELVEPEEGLRLLEAGQIVHSVLARSETNEPGRLVASSIGLAVPREEETFGCLSEHRSCGETAERAGEQAEDRAAGLLATVLGMSFDPDADRDDPREAWRLSGRIVRTLNITEAVEGPADGRWATTVAAAVFCA